MPEPDRRRTLVACIRVTVIVSLTIATLIAVTATLLYVVFGQPTSETSTSVLHVPGNERPVAASGERLSPENRSVTEYLPANRRSLTSGGLREVVSTGRNRYPNNHRYGISDGVGAAFPDRYNATTDAKMEQNIHRQINHIDYSNSETGLTWTTEKDGSTGYRDPYDSTYNVGDYNGNPQTDDQAGISEFNKDPGVESDPYYSTIYGPYHSRPPGSQLFMDYQPLNTDFKLPSKSYQPLNTNYQSPSTGYQFPNFPNINNYQPPATNYQPPSTANYKPPNYEPPTITAPQSPVLGPQQKAATPVPTSTTGAVDWRLVAIVSLVKLGIVKLKSITIIKILLFLVFNLKMLLITVFFKFLLLLKLFKAMVLPLLFVPLLLTALISPMVLYTLLSIPGRIIRFLTTPNNPVAAPSSAPSLMPSQPGIMRPSVQSNVIPGGLSPVLPANMLPGTLAPSRPANAVPGILPPGRPANPPRMPSITRLLDQFIPNNNGMPSAYKSDAENSTYGWYSEALGASYPPIMDVFRKIVDSEKCVERIACRMAVAEKSGIIPLWINWVLQGISKCIPNERLESYFKTYDDVNNEVLLSSRTLDNWTTWCSEHYNCRTTNVK